MYYIIVNPNSKHVSFCNEKKDICFGDTVPNIIPNYTNQQYANDYGDRVISVPSNTETDPYKSPRYDGFEQMTIREYMQVNCKMDIF